MENKRKFMNLTPKNEALELAMKAFEFKTGTEKVKIEESCSRTAAADVFAVNTLPVVRSSGGDGIAVRSSDFAGGMPDTFEWKEGEDYVRADTGDDFDDRFDAVIMIEFVQINENGSVIIDPQAASEVKPGLEVIPSGSMVAAGDLVVPAGKQITASDMAAMATAGISEVEVFKKVSVAFIPTGNELVPAGQKPERGQNIDSNSILVKQMIGEYGGECVCFDIVRDDYEALQQAVDRALEISDIVIINGGSSKGSEDYNTKIITERGNLLFHRVAAGPGMPMAAAAAEGGSKLLVNLPGPTVGAFYCLEWFIKPIMAAAMSMNPAPRRQVNAVLGADAHTPPIMAFHCRVKLEKNSDGTYTAWPLSFEDKGVVRLTCDGAFVSPVGTGLIPAGTEIVVDLYNESL